VLKFLPTALMREATPPPGLDPNAPRCTRNNPTATARNQNSGNKSTSAPATAKVPPAGMPTPIPNLIVIEVAAAAHASESSGEEEVQPRKLGGKRKKAAYVSSEEEEEERYRELGVEEVVETDLHGNEKS
jgi:hypothetical protein